MLPFNLLAEHTNEKLVAACVGLGRNREENPLIIRAYKGLCPASLVWRAS
jgi:hypothetical protein